MNRLIIEGKEADLKANERIKLTRQVNDLREVKNKRTDFTNQFTLPYTPANNKIFEHVRIYSSTSTTPYRYLNCQLLLNGYPVTIEGKIVLDKTDKRGYRVTVYAGLFNLFDELGNRKVSELNLTSLNHEQTHSEVVTRNSSLSDVFYPIYSDGYSLDENVDIKRLVPFVRTDALLQAIVEQVGFTASGGFFTDSLIQSTGVYMNGGLSVFYSQNPNPLTLGGDISQAELVKLLLEITNSFISNVDYINNDLEITKLDSVKNNPYYDWSKKPSNIQPPLIKYETNKVGQSNIFTYDHEEDETTGDANLLVTNTRLDPEKDIVESDFKSIEITDVTISSEIQDVDQIFFFEDKDQVTENIENNVTFIRAKYNTEDIFLSSYKVVNKDINYTYTPYSTLRDFIGYSAKNASSVSLSQTNIRYRNGFFYNTVRLDGSNDYELHKLKFNNNSFELIDKVTSENIGLSSFSNNYVSFDFLDDNTLYFYCSKYTSAPPSSINGFLKVDITGWTSDQDFNGSFVASVLETGPANINFGAGILYNISIYEDKIYVKGDGNTAYSVGVYDISNGVSNPQFLYSFTDGSFSWPFLCDFKVKDNIFYISDFRNNDIVRVYDISNPSSLVLLSTINVDTQYGQEVGTKYLEIHGNILFYFGDRVDGIIQNATTMIDISSGSTSLSTTSDSFPVTDFRPVHWDQLHNQYYQTWKEIFDEYKEVEMFFNLTLQDVIDFDFKRPVYLDTELGASLFYMNKISNYIEGKPTKCTLIKI